jgi:hypothetical protein
MGPDPMIVRRVLATIAAVVLLAACSGDDNERSTTTERSTSTSTSSPSSTSSTAERCDAIEPPASPQDEQSASADVDGDASPDAITTYRTGTPDAPQWHMLVELTAGGGAETIVQGDGQSPVNVIGGADIDGNASAEIWAKVAFGASAEIVGLYRFAECEVSAVQLNGAPASFPVGGSVGNTSGVECADGKVVALSASTSDGETYETTKTSYALADGTLTLSGAETGTVKASDLAAFAPYTAFRCKDLVL